MSYDQLTWSRREHNNSMASAEQKKCSNLRWRILLFIVIYITFIRQRLEDTTAVIYCDNSAL